MSWLVPAPLRFLNWGQMDSSCWYLLEIAIWVHFKLILFFTSLAIYAANAIIGDERLPLLKAKSATSLDAQEMESRGIE